MPRVTARRLPPRRRPRPKPKRKRPVPRNAARRVLSPQPPRAVEIYFLQALRRAALLFARAVSKHVTPALFEKLSRAPRRVKDEDAKEEKQDRADGLGELRLDEDEDDDLDNAEEEDDDIDELDDLERELAEAIDAARNAAAEAYDEKELARASTETGKRAVKHSQNEFQRLGIKVGTEPDTKWLIHGWRKDTLSRMEDLQKFELDTIEEILREGFGRRAESLAKEIDERLTGITLRRAEFIARDSVLTLNGQITEERQTSAGILSFIWTTSQDERVREEHAALEGQEFTWESGGDPEEGIPGEAALCRCTAFPILPELSDEDEDDEALN